MAPSKPRNAAPSSAHTVVDTVDCLLHQSSVETYKYPRSLRFLFYLLATQWQCFGGGGGHREHMWLASHSKRAELDAAETDGLQVVTLHFHRTHAACTCLNQR